MENQHRKIAGYRELSQEEIDLMNRIKAKGAELLALQVELDESLKLNLRTAIMDALNEVSDVDNQHEAILSHDGPACAEYRRGKNAEPRKWAAIGKTDIQTGIMALVRAVAQPAGV